MRTVTVTATIPAPQQAVFDWLANADNYTRSGIVPRVRLRRAGDNARYGHNAVRELTWLTGWFRERITTYHPPHDFGYLVEKSLPPSRHEGGTVVCTPSDAGTMVVWTTTSEVALPLLGPLLTRLLLRPVVTWMFGRILRAAATDLTGPPSGT